MRVYVPRTLGWLLVASLMTHAWQISDASVFLMFALLCIIFPQVLHRYLRRRPTSGVVRSSMFIDALIAGMIAGCLGLEQMPTLVLASMLFVSVLIVGGASLVFKTGIVAAAAALPGYMFRPINPAELNVAAVLCLCAYVSLVGVLVYSETSRLNRRRRHEFSVRRNLEELQLRLEPHVVPQVYRSGENKVQRKRLTVFFSDIVGFTRVMDSHDETAVARWLNSYFGAMTQIANLHGGTVDKFLGDGLMVIFGDMKSRGVVSDAYACVAMAIEMRNQLSKLQAPVNEPGLCIRIGIHTGYCLVGSIGDGDRLDYTALGSTVNLASRIEGAADTGEIVVSEETYRLLRPWITAREKGMVSLKGISNNQRLYSVSSLARPGDHSEPEGRVQLLG